MGPSNPALEKAIRDEVVKYPDMQPCLSEAVTVKFFDAEHKPWGACPQIDPALQDETEWVDPKAVFESKRYSILQRAIDIREHYFTTGDLQGNPKPTYIQVMFWLEPRGTAPESSISP